MSAFARLKVELDQNARHFRLRINHTQKNKHLVNEYFVETCQSVGTASVIQLMPIVDWTDGDVWDYIHKYNLPVNPEYEHSRRVGCIVCPKTNFTSNYIGLLKYPKLIDAFILAREKQEGMVARLIG